MRITSLVTAPVGEPITLEEVRDQVLQGLRVDDTLLRTVILPAVRDRCELYTGRQLLTATYDLWLDRFPCGAQIEVPKPPLLSVDAITYQDTAGTVQTWSSSSYVVQAPAGPHAKPGRIALAFAETWPNTRGEIGDVTVRFTCGYGTRTDIPPLLRQAMLLDAGHLYEHRSEVIVGPGVLGFRLPDGARGIYLQYRVHPVAVAA